MKHKGPSSVATKSLPEQRPMVWETPTPASRRPPIWKRLFFGGNPFRECEPHASPSNIESSALNPSSLETLHAVPQTFDETNDAAVGVDPTNETAAPSASIDPVFEGVVEASRKDDDNDVAASVESSNATPAINALSESLAATRLDSPEDIAVPLDPVVAPISLAIPSLANTQFSKDLPPPPPPPPPLSTPRSSLPKVPKAPSSPRVMRAAPPQRAVSLQRPSTVADRNLSFSSTGSRHRRSSGDWPVAVETLFLEDHEKSMIPTTITPQKAQYVRSVSVLSDLATDIDDEEEDDHIFDLSSDEEDDERSPLERTYSHDGSKGDAGSLSPTTVLSPPNAAPDWMLSWAKTEAKAEEEEEDVNTTASCSTSSNAISSASSDSAWVYCPVEPKVVASEVPSDDPVIFTVGWAALLASDQVTTDAAELLQLPPVTVDCLHYIELLASGTLRSTSASSKETKKVPLDHPSQWSMRDVCPQSLGKCLVLPMISSDDKDACCCYILPVHVSAHSLERLRLGKVPTKLSSSSSDDYAPMAQQDAVLFVRFSMDAAYRMHAKKLL